MALSTSRAIAAAVKGPMVAKLVKVLALYMSGLAGPTVGLQEARVFAGNKVTRATRCPPA